MADTRTERASRGGGFSIARLPRIEFGCGSAQRLPELAARYGQRALLVTGARALERSAVWPRLQKGLRELRLEYDVITVDGEPSPRLVDDAVGAYRKAYFDVVVGVGGGSAMDAAKAIAGLLRTGRSVMDHLEGVGPELPYTGPAVPFIAAPTTAGTGSEATKNAVLSTHGEHGFKKSFRHDDLVAQYAVIDPDLLATCPKDIVAANGMDALTQLIESYVSVRSNPFTDALCLEGLAAARDGLLPFFRDNDALARERMAFASLVSGVCLAQTGLGSVHGLASPLGAFYPIPHGVVCGTLVGAATDANIQAMLARDPDNPALTKYARISEVLCLNVSPSVESACAALVRLLSDWTQRMNLPRLSRFGLSQDGLERVIANAHGSSMQTNPIVLTDDELRTVLLERL